MFRAQRLKRRETLQLLRQSLKHRILPPHLQSLMGQRLLQQHPLPIQFRENYRWKKKIIIQK